MLVCDHVDVGCILGSDFLLKHTKYINYEEAGKEKLVFRHEKFGEVAISIKSQANQQHIDNPNTHTSTTTIPPTHIHARSITGMQEGEEKVDVVEWEKREREESMDVHDEMCEQILSHVQKTTPSLSEQEKQMLC